jgi:hypothetical protein
MVQGRSLCRVGVQVYAGKRTSHIFSRPTGALADSDDADRHRQHISWRKRGCRSTAYSLCKPAAAQHVTHIVSVGPCLGGTSTVRPLITPTRLISAHGCWSFEALPPPLTRCNSLCNSLCSAGDCTYLCTAKGKDTPCLHRAGDRVTFLWSIVHVVHHEDDAVSVHRALYSTHGCSAGTWVKNAYASVR